jgi:DNA-binding transcriptional LysR family regulator
MGFDTQLLSGIQVVAAVTDAGSFAKAGKALGLSQSGVSRAIQRLEERLGVRLFDRNAKTMRLTEAGHRFCDEVLPLISQIEEAAESVVQSTAKLTGRLRINVDPMFAKLILVPRLQVFLDQHPELYLELAAQNQFGNLIADGFDAVIRFGEPQPSSLIAKRLLQVHVVTCASPIYLRKYGRPKRPQELATKNHPCILFTDPTKGIPFPWEFHRGKEILTVPVCGRLIVNDGPSYLEACLSGLGIAQLFRLNIEPLLASGQLIQLFPDWSDEAFPLYVYHSTRHFVPARLRAFLDFLSSIANNRDYV